MALNPHLSVAAATAAADTLAALCNGGVVRLYDGVQPATANTAVTTQVLLATVTFANPAFGAAVAGVATANAMTADSDADATGTATWFRALSSASATVFDGSCGTADADCVLSSTAIVQHASVTITSVTLTVPLS
mgnify:CR=1 FL=1